MALPGSSTKSSGHDLSHLRDVLAGEFLGGQDEQDAEGTETVEEQPQEYREEVLPESSHKVPEVIDLHNLCSHQEEYSKR